MNDEAIDYDTKLSSIYQKSSQRAWYFNFILSLSLVVTLIYHFYKPVLKIEPYVLVLDKNTGLTQMLSSVSESKETWNEALDKSFVEQYVRKREQYFYNLLENDYVYVQANSSEQVAKAYVAIYKGKNARDKLLKQNVEVVVKTLSVSLNKSGNIKNATMRIEVTEKHKNGISTKKIKIITLSYVFKPDIKVTEKERLINPLGFRVITYRVDMEVKND